MKCPTCNTEGQKVAHQTIRHILKPRCEIKIGEKDYYLCMNPDCDVGYYNSEAVFDKSDLKVPLWYKKDANPKYACYCRKISHDEVIKTVLETDLTDAGDIMFHLRGELRAAAKLTTPQATVVILYSTKWSRKRSKSKRQNPAKNKSYPTAIDNLTELSIFALPGTVPCQKHRLLFAILADCMFQGFFRTTPHIFGHLLSLNSLYRIFRRQKWFCPQTAFPSP